jgi:hypothetical protein
MPYAFTQDVPIDATTYARIREGIGDEPPPGLIVHLAIELPEAGLRYMAVWESEQHSDRFSEQRLHPVVHPMLSESSAMTSHRDPTAPRCPSSTRGSRL